MQDGQQPLVIPDEIREFLDQLFQDAGLVVRDSVKEKMIQELFIELDIFLRTEIVKRLPEEKLQEFAQFISQQPNPEQVRDYLQKNIPNSEEVFSEAFNAFRQLYLKGTTPEPQQPTLEDLAHN